MPSIPTHLQLDRAGEQGTRETAGCDDVAEGSRRLEALACRDTDAPEAAGQRFGVDVASVGIAPIAFALE